MFGDKEAYTEKFKTAARTRPLDNQILGKDFYMKEHTKPLFKQNGLLTAHNLYKYTCLLEMFKINKLESPKSLLNFFHRSPRRTEYFITTTPASSFIYQSSNMWNTSRKTSSQINFSTSTNTMKLKLKMALLEMQSRYDVVDWCELNFDPKELTF